MLRTFGLLVLCVAHSYGGDVRANKDGSVDSVSEVHVANSRNSRKLFAKPTCEEFGELCTKCGGNNGCTQCGDGSILVFDSLNNYWICEVSNPVAAPSKSPSLPTPLPTIPTLLPTPPTPLPSDPVAAPSDQPTPTGQECKRYRKPWHLSTESERLLYINGWLQLHSGSNNVIEAMSDMHNQNINGNANHNAHGTSAFLPWHRYYLWEIESQFRSLGGEYSCFSMPFWDWGHDAFASSTSVIYSTGLSKEGKRPNMCVQDSYFDDASYTIHGNCLDRSGNDEIDLFSGSSFDNSAELITDIVDFGSFLDYRPQLENSHNSPHCAIGGDMCTGYSPDDPLFYLHHGYIDFLWAVWQDCHDYDLVTKEELDVNVNAHIYSHGTTTNVELDDLMDFSMIAGESWSMVNDYNPTMRDMHSIVDWNIQYDIGSFWNEAGVEDVLYCGANAMNDEWFGDQIARRRMVEDTDTVAEYMEEQRDLMNARDDLSLEEKREEMYSIGCEYSKNNVIDNGWIGESCKIPSDFEDCSDIEEDLNEDEKKWYNLPLQALLNKAGVKDSQCLKNIRSQIYPWLEMVGGLLDLCDGIYDPKC